MYISNTISQISIFSIINSSFLQNSAIHRGGAIYIEDAFVNIFGSLFENNEALQGGAMYSSTKSMIYLTNI